MPALIPELIALASDPTVKTTDLLRKALVAARLLKQPEWATWIDYELDGYPEGIDPPSYRQLRGELYFTTPGRGLSALPIVNVELHELMSSCLFYYPIGAVEALATGGEQIRLPMDAHKQALISKLYRTETPSETRFGANQVQVLLDTVRNKVLRWALDLGDAGILGEGMSFTPQEQQQAQQLAPETHIHIRDFTGGQLMLNSPAGQQQQTVTGDQKVAALDALLPWLQQQVEAGQLPREERDQLQSQHAALQALATSPKPGWHVIGALASSVRAILEGAGGGVLTAQVLGWLTTLGG
ncbi:AbiTii domain-containing protein [Aeromonas sp. Y311-2]|uniref:AbiTii domain-containing protein n=1 Tax=Aeromonas sp. Y311-2 TaxID=2990507 RepID=UPI0022E70DEB|nr:hypothetical protein [Aeromonas sp. Y311-2]